MTGRLLTRLNQSFLQNVQKIRHHGTVSPKAATIILNRKKYLSPSLKTFEAYQTPFVIHRGNMQYVYDIDDNKYIDMLGQNLCISVGHSNPKVVEPAYAQMKKLAHCTTMYHNEESASLAKEMVELLPPHPSGQDWVVHLVNSGSEAVDLAIQMAKQYTGHDKMYALYKAYHGLQGYAAGLTSIGKATQKCYESMFPGIVHVESNNIDQLENSIIYNTFNGVAGLIIEPLQGFGGIHPLHDGYMKNAFELIRKHGGVAIADEVQTGYGRCGESFWGFQMKNNDAIPDMITCAKGMGNGVGIIGAVICRRDIAEAFSEKVFFNTYGANPVAAAAARAVIRTMKEDNVMENCRIMGEIFNTKLTELCDKYPSIYKEVRGQGLFQGLEVYGKDLEDSVRRSINLHKNTLKYGVVLGRGSAAGNVFRIQPPMCIQEQDVLRVVDILEDLAHQATK